MIEQMVLYILFLLMLKTMHVDSSNHINLTDTNNTTTHSYLEKMSEMRLKALRPLDFSLLPVIFAESDYLSDGQCKADARRFLNGLQNGTLWAVQMYDSSAKYPEGFLYGNTRHLGNFDECYNLQVNMLDEDVDEITGRYCLVDIEYRRKNISLVTKTPIPEFDAHDSFWEAVEGRQDFIRIPRDHLQIAVCVPSSCTAKDLEAALKVPLEKIGASNNIILQTGVQAHFCQTAKEAPQFTAGAKVFCAVLVMVFIIVIYATFYDIVLNNNENNQNPISHFSVKKSLKSICQVSYVHPGLDSIYFLRSVLIIGIVFAHRMYGNYTIPCIDMNNFENLFKVPLAMLLLNVSVGNEMFHAIGGILMTYKLLEDLNRTKRLNFIRNVILTYIRLAPTVLVIMCFLIWIFPLLGSGPFWKDLVEDQSINCATNWWTYLLFINNYVKNEKTCIVTLWYTSVDFQHFIVGQLILYAFWRMPRKGGYTFLGMLTLVSCIPPFVSTYVYNLAPLFRFTPKIYQRSLLLEDSYFSSYRASHLRLTSYLIGIITGAIIYDYNNSTYRLSTFWTHVLMLPVPFTLCFLCQLWAYRFMIPYISWNPLEGAIFTVSQKILFSSSICIIILALTFGSQHDYYYYLHLNPWAQTFSRLHYGIVLLHIVFLAFYYGQIKSASTLAFYDILSGTIVVVFFSSLVALVIRIFINEPIKSIAKQLFMSKNTIKKRESDDNVKKIQ